MVCFFKLHQRQWSFVFGLWSFVTGFSSQFLILSPSYEP
jgi:hypothetical protein